MALLMRVQVRHGGFLAASEAAMPTTPPGPHAAPAHHRQPARPERWRPASLVKPAELVDVVELTPLTLVDRRTYNLLMAYRLGPDRRGRRARHPEGGAARHAQEQ